ncbi:MAG: hypothetical protein WBG43_00200 [Marinifilaceae bacterium]
MKTYIDRIQEIADEKGISFSEVIEVFKLAETDRKNDLSVRNLDVFDEQIAWLGNIFEVALEILKEESSWRNAKRNEEVGMS